MVQLSANSVSSIRPASDVFSFQARLLHYQPVLALLTFSVDGILSTLKCYVQELEKKQENLLSPAPVPSELAAHATSSPQPLCQRDTGILTQLCHSMRDLEETTRTPKKRARLAEYLTPVAVQNVVDFWEAEWLADQ